MRSLNRAVSGGFLLLTALFLFAPVVIVVLFAFNSSASSVEFGGFSLRWFRDLFANDAFMSAFGNTLKSAVLTVIIVEILALPAAVMMARAGIRVRNMLQTLFNVTIIVPGLIIGVALIATLNNLPIKLGLGTVVLGHVLVAFPLVLMILLARLERMDMSVISAARDLGASAPVAYRRVFLPLILPSLVGAGLIAAAWSIDEFIITLFTNGGTVTVPVYLYTLLTKYGATPEFNAAATLILVINLAAIVTAYRFVKDSFK